MTQRVVSADMCAGAGSTPRTSLADLGKESAWQRLREIAEQDLAIPFDLQQAPLLRAHIYVLSDDAVTDDVVLLVTAHHIIADGMCVQLIRDELSQAYSRDIRRPLPELQYADFSRWQRERVGVHGKRF